MGSVYTKGIETGEIKTGRDFLINCIPEFEGNGDGEVALFPDMYSKQQIDITLGKLMEIRSSSEEDLQSTIDTEYSDRQEFLKNELDKHAVLSAIYIKIMCEVIGWDAVGEEQDALKRFALGLISSEMAPIVNNNIKDELAKPKMSVVEYVVSKTKALEADLDYYRIQWKSELRAVKERNARIKEMKNSLGLKEEEE